MGAVEAVERELNGMPVDVKQSAVAAAALAMAKELDDIVSEQECEECGHVQSWMSRANSATSKSMCAARLIEAMDRLRELAPPKRSADGIDDLSAAREERLERARRSGAAHLDGAGGV